VRLALIADSNEPGQSGVGDYALLLAGALERLDVTTEVFSLGACGSEQRRSLSARVAAFEPDWLSFQYVPYAYAHRGMVTRTTLPWKALRGRTGTHVMFHEIWIGSHEGASIRDRFMGWLQKRGIRSIVQLLKPEVIHCSNRLYSAMLAHAGIQNQILPLFGNVPVVVSKTDPYEALVSSLQPGSPRKGWLVAAFFGTIHPNSSALTVLQWLKEKALLSGRHLLVVSLGRCPNAAGYFQSWAETLNDQENVRFEVRGELPPDELSGWLGAADCGLSTTPYNIIEKSGSAVAFAEHGVPVLVTDLGAPVRHCDVPDQSLAPRFWLANDATLGTLSDVPPRQPDGNLVDEVASTFLRQLSHV
jgi:glycosyltransferase involved in cell wall biosynthesis